MERVGRVWLVLLLCWGATSLAAGVGGGQGTRSNALGVDSVKNCRGRGGDKAVVGDPPPLPSPPPPLPAPSSDEPQGPQHLPGRFKPSTTEGTRRRYHHHLLLPHHPRLTKGTPSLSQPTATDWLQATSSGPAGSSRAPLLRRRQRRSSPAVVPPSGLYTEPQATPPQSPSAPATHKASSQDDDHSQTSNAPPPPQQQSAVSIPRIVSNILQLLPNLLESGLHIPASVSPASRPRGSLSGQRRDARPTSHSVDEGISSTQRRRFTPLPPPSWAPAAPPAPPPLSQPIHITINIAAGALAPTPQGSLGLAPTPQESLGLPRPPAPPATLIRGPLRPSGVQTHFDDEEGIPTQFPPTTEPPKRDRPHITILPVRYPSQEAPLPSHFSPSDRPSPPQTSIITTRLGTQTPTTQLLTPIPSADAITFPGDPSPSPPFTKPQPPPQTSTRPANDTGSSQAPRDSEPQLQQIFFVLPDPELLTFPTSDGQRLPTNLTESVRIIVVVPLRDCPEVCEVRIPDTMGCELDEACLANLRADMDI
ncbi:uncharacterized protein [Panulirus ornatus]|uniref:uncharacterized protein isoform X2 n=1 Tax=Panulirus ornatus TaxID=150431 RepID=UPI003A8A0C9B